MWKYKSNKFSFIFNKYCNLKSHNLNFQTNEIFYKNPLNNLDTGFKLQFRHYLADSPCCATEWLSKLV